MQGAVPITFVTGEKQALKTLGERVKWARATRGMSQSDLAKAAKVTQGTIGNLEAGIRKTSRSLLNIAKGLKANADWLETGKGEWDASRGTGPIKGAVFKEPSPDEWVLLAHWRHLLSSDKKALVEKIAALAEEREAQKQELFAEAGVDRIMAKAANEVRHKNDVATAVPGDPRHKQEPLRFEPEGQ